MTSKSYLEHLPIPGHHFISKCRGSTAVQESLSHLVLSDGKLMAVIVPILTFTFASNWTVHLQKPNLATRLALNTRGLALLLLPLNFWQYSASIPFAGTCNLGGYCSSLDSTISSEASSYDTPAKIPQIFSLLILHIILCCQEFSQKLHWNSKGWVQ